MEEQKHAHHPGAEGANKAQKAIFVTTFLPNGQSHSEEYDETSTFGEITRKAAEVSHFAMMPELDVFEMDGDRPFMPDETLAQAGLKGKAEIQLRRALIHIVVSTTNGPFYANLSPNTPLAHVEYLVKNSPDLGLIIGPEENWTLTRENSVEALDLSQSLVDLGFKGNAKLEFAKRQHQGG